MNQKLPMNCDNCALCCIHARPMIAHNETCDLPGDLLETIGEYRSVRKKEDGSCLLLDENKRCSRYDQRPRACAVFRFGGLLCQDMRKKYLRS